MRDLETITTQEHKQLQEALAAFAMGKKSPAELKHATAPFGIYQQKNGKFMIRIRVTGGILFAQDMQSVSKILSTHEEIGFAHQTTRQNIQLHNVPVEQVFPIVNDAINSGLTFRGGGGNTYRNIAVSPESGISEDSVFDVHPHAQAIQNFVFGYHDAYSLPRKLKISISCSDTDTALATVQDLGFIAHVRDGQRGFKVYMGGGMGRSSMPGLKVFEFLPEQNLLKAVAAVIDFFYDHGNRENRNQARMRFLREKLGDDQFIQLYMNYYTKTTAEKIDLDPPAPVPAIEFAPQINNNSKQFKLWQTRATSKTSLGEDIVSVELFVPNGNFNAEQFSKLSDFLTENQCSQIRLKANQNLLIPAVKEESLSGLYEFLSSYTPDLTGTSFKGMMQSCIGSTICKIGILDTPSYAETAAEALDAHFADKPEKQAEMYREIIQSIRFSGCPNSCGAHQAAKLGFQGLRKKLDGKMTDIFNICRDAHIAADKTALAIPDTDFIHAEEVASLISDWITQK